MGFLNNVLTTLTGVPQDGQQGDGQSGGDAFVKILKSSLGIGAKQERPGSLCVHDCTLEGDVCIDCVKRQEAILAASDRLEELERAVENANNSPYAAAAPKPVKCSLCGAPIELIETACPYCDTPYPPEALIPDIPRSKREQQQLLLKTSTETYKMYTDWFEDLADKNTNGMKGVLGGMMKFMSSYSGSTVKMNEEQIQQGAQHYGVPYTEYVSGVLQKKYQTVWGIKQEEQAKRAEEDQKRRREELEQRRQELEAKQAKTNADIAARNRSLEEMRAKNAASRKELADLQSRIAVSKVTDYGVGVGGGSSSCCGNCRHYIVGDNKCAYNEYKHPSGANDYCNNFWRK